MEVVLFGSGFHARLDKAKGRLFVKADNYGCRVVFFSLKVIIMHGLTFLIQYSHVVLCKALRSFMDLCLKTIHYYYYYYHKRKLFSDCDVYSGD